MTAAARSGQEDEQLHQGQALSDNRPTRYQRPPKTEFDYGRVIKENLSLVWRHKFLWFFGLFSGTASALGGWSCDYNSYVTTPGESESESAREIADSILQWLQDHLTLIITIAVASLAISILLWLWSILCHGAVVASVRDIHRDEPVNFASAFQRGKSNFRSLFPYMLLVALLPLLIILALTAVGVLIYLLLTAMGSIGEAVGIAVLALLGAAAFATMVSTLGFFAVLGIGPVLMIVAFLIFNLGSRFVVLSDQRPVAALKNGARLLLENLSKGAMLFIISVGVSIGSTIVMVFVGALAAIPAIIAWIFAFGAGISAGGIVIASLLSLPPLIVGLLFTAALNTYFTSFWTDSWMLFTGEKKHETKEQVGRSG
jgi:hypothetical protein